MTQFFFFDFQKKVLPLPQNIFDKRYFWHLKYRLSDKNGT